MTSYLAQRLLLMIPTFIGITLIGFLIMRLAPGDPAELRAAGGLGAAAAPVFPLKSAAPSTRRWPSGARSMASTNRCTFNTSFG